MGPDQSLDTRVIIYRLFYEAAETDYIAARWAARSNLEYQFYWMSQQALEKMLKACLLLHGVSVKDFSHDLIPMVEKLCATVGRLLPSVVFLPPCFSLERFRNHQPAEPLIQFAERIYREGHPNNRYRYYSSSQRTFDLHKLDEVFFLLRRICFPTSITVDQLSLPLSKLIEEEPNFQILGHFRCLSNKNRRGYRETYSAYAWLNYSFCHESAFSKRRVLTGWGSINSPIFMALQPETSARESLNWILDHVKFSKKDQTEITALLDRLARGS